MPETAPSLHDMIRIADGLPVREILPALCAHLAGAATAQDPEGHNSAQAPAIAPTRTPPTGTPPAGASPVGTATVGTATVGTSINAIVVAPPGAGKTTSIPPVLAAAPWRAQDDRIIMLEPRRLAARAAAQRIAALLGEEAGGFVGYRTRVDSAMSARTRIEVLTEGLFLRRLLDDPMLEGVACVIIDEVHERSLDADLAIAFCLDLQRNLRPDLRLVAMSATAETEKLAAYMNAPVFTSAGRMFELSIHHARKDIPSVRDIPAATANGVRQALAETQGDILVFLPGTGEIRRTAQLLADTGVTVLPLHGELHPAEQARVLRPGNEGERRVILATSIAETSLTVPGVRAVVDCGFRRTPRFDAGAGLSRLDTVRISKAAARQRAGRAGREAPGVAYCLWTPHTERALPQHDKPEILEADLSDFVLATTLWADTLGTGTPEPDTKGTGAQETGTQETGTQGTSPPKTTGTTLPGQPDNALPLLDTPPGAAVSVARELLVLLGALDDTGAITPLGRRMATLGTHPRLAAMLLAALVLLAFRLCRV
ncbi:MAG: helicase-related protein, partial [Acetobacter sp.]|uniref:helicase-related protein n=1 Tax=Acetobacter sp. TaxID=440 RepID=UPI0039EC6955